MAIIPNLAPIRSYENQGLDVGANHLLGYELIPTAAHLAYQSYDLVVSSASDMGPDQYTVMCLTAWLLPLSGTEATAFYASFAEVKALANKMIPMSAPLTKAGLSRATVEGYASTWEDSFAAVSDLSLIYRPDGIKFTKLVTPDRMEAQLLSKRIQKVGWNYSTAYRTGSDLSGTAGMRVANRMQGSLPSGISLPYPSIVCWFLTIPSDVDDSAWEPASPTASSGNAAITEFSDLDFLSPERQLFSGDIASYDASVMERATGWLNQHIVEGNSSNRLWEQQSLNVVFWRDAVFMVQVRDRTPSVLGSEVPRG